MKPKEPAEPGQRGDTVRKSIVALLLRSAATARDISEEVGIADNEVYGHLEHIRHSLHREERSLSVTAAECRGCGFVFAKRERLKRPGRCPICRGQSISAPRFKIG